MRAGNPKNTDEGPRLGDELANAITHGFGALMAVGAFIFLVLEADPGTKVASAIYGLSLVVLYLASTLYHSLVFTRARDLFRKFDHMAIFLLIAGTYTPFCLTALNGWVGWTMLSAVWGLAVAGIVLKSLYTGKFEWVSISIYVSTGWMVVLAIKPIYESLSLAGFLCLVGGGLAYTVGTFFYVNTRIAFHHSIWHLWVLAGSALHFFSVLTIVKS